MATMLDIVTRAYRKAAISASGETLAAEIASEGIDELNMMLAAWKIAGVDIGHNELALSDTFPLPLEYQEGTVYMLAGRVAPGFQTPVGFDADDFFRRIQADYSTMNTALNEEMEMPDGLQRAPSQYWPRTRMRR